MDYIVVGACSALKISGVVGVQSSELLQFCNIFQTNFYFKINSCTLGGRTGSALVWHLRGRAFESRLVQQVLLFVGCVNTAIR